MRISYAIDDRFHVKFFRRVELFENAIQNEWYISFKIKYWSKIDNAQVKWLKDEKLFEKKVKKYVKLLKEKRLQSNSSSNDQSSFSMMHSFDYESTSIWTIE